MLPVNAGGWCPWRESDPRPLPYQGSALPLSHMGVCLSVPQELAGRMTSGCGGVERETGIEPAPSAWKAEVLPLNYSRHDRGRRTIIAHSAQLAPRSCTAAQTRVRARHACGYDCETASKLRRNCLETDSKSSLLVRCPGGGGWIRTNVGVSQQIYSLPPLATRAPLRGEPTILKASGRFVNCPGRGAARTARAAPGPGRRGASAPRRPGRRARRASASAPRPAGWRSRFR